MKSMLIGECEHTVKVTYLGKGLYGCRVFVGDVLNAEGVAYGRDQIGLVCRSLLRMEDKCGNFSHYASRARHRIGEKSINRRGM